jgi:hypothetical protein
MRKDMKIFVWVASGFSAVFAVLLFTAIQGRYGTFKSLLFCLAGVAAIWLFGYLKCRLFGWIRPGRVKKETVGGQQQEGPQ